MRFRLRWTAFKTLMGGKARARWAQARAIGRWIEPRAILLAGLAGVAGFIAGVCGLAVWLLPTAPPWALYATIGGGSLACLALGGRWLVTELAALGALGILRKEGQAAKGRSAGP